MAEPRMIKGPWDGGPCIFFGANIEFEVHKIGKELVIKNRRRDTQAPTAESYWIPKVMYIKAKKMAGAAFKQAERRWQMKVGKP